MQIEVHELRITNKYLLFKRTTDPRGITEDCFIAGWRHGLIGATVLGAAFRDGMGERMEGSTLLQDDA